MIIRVSTIRFTGPGSIDCRLCSHRTVFPVDTQALIFSEVSLNRQIIRSAIDLSTLHRCGIDYYWQCTSCGQEGTSHYRRGRLVAICRLCRGDLEQRTRVPVDNPVG